MKLGEDHSTRLGGVVGHEQHLLPLVHQAVDTLDRACVIFMIRQRCYMYAVSTVRLQAVPGIALSPNQMTPSMSKINMSLPSKRERRRAVSSSRLVGCDLCWDADLEVSG